MSGPAIGATPGLVKATLANLDTLEMMAVSWNPSRYRIRRRSRLQTERTLGDTGAQGGGGSPPGRLSEGEERFETRLFIDTTDAAPGPERNARAFVDRLARWMEPLPGTQHPPRIAFIWGPLRFAGQVLAMEEEWLRFDPDGTPVRAWISLRMRKC